MLDNIFIILIVAAVVGLAGFYIYRQKKNGSKCIGCPYGCSCSSKNEKGGCCCHSEEP